VFANDRHVQVSNQPLFQFRFSSNIDLSTELQNQVRNFLYQLVQELSQRWKSNTNEEVYGAKAHKGEVISLEIGKLHNEWCLNLEIDSDRVLGFTVGPDLEKCLGDLKAMALDTWANWQHSNEGDTQFGLETQPLSQNSLSQDSLPQDRKTAFFKAI